MNKSSAKKYEIIVVALNNFLVWVKTKKNAIQKIASKISKITKKRIKTQGEKNMDLKCIYI